MLAHHSQLPPNQRHPNSLPHGSTESVSTSVEDMGWTRAANATIQYYDDIFRAKIPIFMHVGCMGLAPESHSYVDSIPPLPTGGNLDNRRIGVGTILFLGL